MSIKFELDYDTFLALVVAAAVKARTKIEEVKEEEQRILDAYNAKGFWYKLWHESDIDSWWYWHNVGYSHEIISLYEKYSNLKNPPKNVIVSQRIYDHIKR